MKNSLKVVVSPSTVGIYICLKCNGGECVLIRIVEQIVERTFCTVEGEWLKNLNRQCHEDDIVLKWEDDSCH